MRTIHKLLLVTAFTAVIVAAIVAVRKTLGPVRPVKLVERIERGMSPDEVKDILGPPSIVDSESMTYEACWNPGWLIVHFDESGCVSYVDHEIAVFR